jgi:hypothetical protein
VAQVSPTEGRLIGGTIVIVGARNLCPQASGLCHQSTFSAEFIGKNGSLSHTSYAAQVLGHVFLDEWDAQGIEHSSILGNTVIADSLSAFGKDVWVQWTGVVNSLRHSASACNTSTCANSLLLFLRTPQVSVLLSGLATNDIESSASEAYQHEHMYTP